MGAAIIIGSTSTVNFNSGTISNNTASSGGAIRVTGNSRFNMYGGSITNNRGNVNAGGICVDGNSIITLQGGTISGNSGVLGAGIGIWTGSLTINGTSIINNTASNNGGGVFYVSNVSYNYISGNISGNSPNNVYRSS